MPFDPNSAAPAASVPGTAFDPSSAMASEFFQRLTNAANSVGETGKNIVGFGKELGTNLMGGFARGINGLDATSHRIFSLPNAARTVGEMGANAITGQPPINNAENARNIENFDPTLPLEKDGSNQASVLMQAGMRGIGGAAVVPVPGAGVFGNAFPGLLAGMGGQLGGQYAESLHSPTLRKIAEFLSSVAPGMLGGYLAGPRQTPGQAKIRDAIKDTPPATFTDAANTLDLFKRAGAQTGTVAEAFPPNSALMTLATDTRNTALDNALRQATENRPEDIQRLSQIFKDRVGTQVDPNSTANDTAGAANAVIQDAKNTRNTAIANRLGSEPPIRPDQVAMVEKYLIDQSNDPGITPSRQAAYREAASKMRDAQGNLLTNLQDLSLRLVEMQDAPKNPNFTGFQGRPVQGYDINEALGNARDAISAFRPGFGDALKDFGNFSQNVLTPLKQGPVGTLSDRNPLAAGQTPASKLPGLLTGNVPAAVGGTAKTLGDPTFAGSDAVHPLDIARAIAELKLAKNPTNPGAAMRGGEGSLQQQNFEALLNAGGGNSSHIMEPLIAADKLQPFSGPAIHNELPKMSLGQMLIRPFRTADMVLTSGNQRAVNEEVAKILARNDPQVVGELQKMAMFDPGIRQALSLRAIFAANPTLNPQDGSK